MRKNAFCPKIIEKLAKKYNVSKEVAEYVTRSQFRYVAHIIEEGKGEAVRLHYLGRFRIKYRNNGKKLDKESISLNKEKGDKR